MYRNKITFYIFQRKFFLNLFFFLTGNFWSIIIRIDTAEPKINQEINKGLTNLLI